MVDFEGNLTERGIAMRRWTSILSVVVVLVMVALHRQGLWAVFSQPWQWAATLWLPLWSAALTGLQARRKT